jgi:hypothetical protein
MQQVRQVEMWCQSESTEGVASEEVRQHEDMAQASALNSAVPVAFDSEVCPVN